MPGMNNLSMRIFSAPVDIDFQVECDNLTLEYFFVA